MRTQCISHWKRFETFRNCCLFCTFWLLRNFYSGDGPHGNCGEHCSSHHFRHWTLCRLDLQCFQTFRNCCSFCAFSLIRNIYCGDAHDANYCKHSLNHHFQYWTHSVYQIYSVLKFFEIPVSFPPFGFLRNFYCGDAHHANYGKHSLNHRLQHCEHSVYQTYSVLKLLEIRVCFTHFGFYEISTPVVRIILRQNSLNHHFQYCAHSVYQIYSVLNLFEIAVCFAHFGFYEISTPVVRIMLTMASIV